MKEIFTKCLPFIYIFVCLSGYKGLQDPTQNTENKNQNESIINDEEDYSYILPNYLNLTLDWGIASLLYTPLNMDLGFWKSRILCGTIYYNIPIAKSNFMFSAG